MGKFKSKVGIEGEYFGMEEDQNDEEYFGMEEDQNDEEYVSVFYLDNCSEKDIPAARMGMGMSFQNKMEQLKRLKLIINTLGLLITTPLRILL